MGFKYKFLEEYSNLPGLNTKHRAKVIELCLKLELALDELNSLKSCISKEHHAKIQEKVVEAENLAPVLAEQIHQESISEDKSDYSPELRENHSHSKKSRKKKLN